VAGCAAVSAKSVSGSHARASYARRREERSAVGSTCHILRAVGLEAERHAAELRQGAKLAAMRAERVWGWDGPAGRLRAARRARFLIERCALGPGVRCLELGAGTGVFTELLVESGCELVAVELSPDAAARCRLRVRERADVVVGNIETGSGLNSVPFDAIVGVSVLHHVDLPATLANTFAFLRPGGRFAFTEPNIRNPQVWAERNIGWLARRRHVLPHERAFTAQGLRRAFEHAGLIVETSEPFEFLHPLTPAPFVSNVCRLERLLERTPVRQVAGSVQLAGQRPG
jgi:SAM-dependent methyltransferase